MKNLAIAVLTTVLSMGCLSCSGQQADKSKEKEVTTKETKMKTIKLNKADFLAKIMNYEANPNEWKYLGDKPAIIDFYADWCGPCRMVAPSLEELAGEYEGKIYIYKVDTEVEKEIAGLFGIRSIPSLLFIPMTGKPQMAQGALPKTDLKKAIDDFLLK
jgi:thioredoxin